MKTLKIAATLFATLALFGQSCNKEFSRIEGMGSITTETLNIEDFTAIRLEGANDVDIIYGSEQKIEITGHPNIISRIKTEVRNGTWDMGLEKGNYGYYELMYSLTLPMLTRVEISGSADVSIKQTLQTDDFELFLMGSGSFNGFGLQTTDALIEIIGSGNCEITTADLLEVFIEGSGSVYYKGKPSIMTDINGSGRIVDAN